MAEAGHDTDASLYDPLVALAAAAAVTSRIKLGTGICLAAQHDPITLAKQVATLDQISAGRVLFGVGPGWLEDEMRDHRLQPAQRWKALEESILALKQIWSADEAEFHGRHVSFDPILSWPKPLQVPHPPVLVAGRAPRVFARVVRYGDGWIPVVTAGLDIEGHMTALAALCQDAGRATVPVTAVLWHADRELMARCAQAGVRRCLIFVPPERLATIQDLTGALEHVKDGMRP